MTTEFPVQNHDLTDGGFHKVNVCPDPDIENEACPNSLDIEPASTPHEHQGEDHRDKNINMESESLDNSSTISMATVQSENKIMTTPPESVDLSNCHDDVIQNGKESLTEISNGSAPKQVKVDRENGPAQKMAEISEDHLSANENQDPPPNEVKMENGGGVVDQIDLTQPPPPPPSSSPPNTENINNMAAAVVPNRRESAENDNCLIKGTKQMLMALNDSLSNDEENKFVESESENQMTDAVTTVHKNLLDSPVGNTDLTVSGDTPLQHPIAKTIEKNDDDTEPTRNTPETASKTSLQSPSSQRVKEEVTKVTAETGHLCSSDPAHSAGVVESPNNLDNKESSCTEAEEEKKIVTTTTTTVNGSASNEVKDFAGIIENFTAKAKKYGLKVIVDRQEAASVSASAPDGSVSTSTPTPTPTPTPKKVVTISFEGTIKDGLDPKAVVKELMSTIPNLANTRETKSVTKKTIKK